MEELDRLKQELQKKDRLIKEKEDEVKKMTDEHKTHAANSTRLLEEERNRLREELASNFEERLKALGRQHEQELQKATETLEQKRQTETLTAGKELEQLKFILQQKEQTLSEREEAMKAKDEEVRALLKQLAAVPLDSQSPSDPEVKEEAAEPQIKHFEVLFALEGSLGLEFQELAAPYIITKVHPDRIATGLGINPGDELVGVGDDAVTEASWPELVRKLSVRPVVAKFKRETATTAKSDQDSSLLSSVSLAGTSFLSAAARHANSLKNRGAAQPAGDAAGGDVARLQADVERLTLLLRARDAELAESKAAILQTQKALAVLEGSHTDGDLLSKVVQEKEQLSAQLQSAQAEVHRLGGQSQEMQNLQQQLEEERRLKEENEKKVASLTEQCNSLLTQFETLKQTCQGLSIDSKQKAELEEQVQELAQMNAQWQQVHQNMSSESEQLRKQAAEVHFLQGEVQRLRQFEQGWGGVQELEQRLHEALVQVSMHDQEREEDRATIQRLSDQLLSMQDYQGFETSDLEAELMECNAERRTLRQRTEELEGRLQQLEKTQQESQEIVEAGKQMKVENEQMKIDLSKAQAEQEKLREVVDRCLTKMEKEAQERPYLVDKRMVTQMVAAYLEQKHHPRQQHEILARMADLLGFTSAEREQVGLSQKRRGLLDQDESAGLAELSDRFVDFLFEESEAP